MELLFWPLLGALIGVAASRKKGFSTTVGVLGGLLLGLGRSPRPTDKWRMRRCPGSAGTPC